MLFLCSLPRRLHFAIIKTLCLTELHFGGKPKGEPGLPLLPYVRFLTIVKKNVGVLLMGWGHIDLFPMGVDHACKKRPSSLGEVG